MKFNRHGPQYRAQSSIPCEEIHALCGACKFPHVYQDLAARGEAQAFRNKPVLSKVVQVRVKDVFVDALSNFVVLGVRGASGIHGGKAGENLKLQAPIKLHRPGLRDRRFEWDQNNITAWPGTHLRPG